MKARKKELDVDFIGGGEPLTKDEERKISEFIKSRKSKQRVAAKTKKNTTKKKSDRIVALLPIE